MLEITSKKCSNPRCAIKGFQPIANFHKNRKKHDGRNGRCRNCDKIRHFEYRQTKNGKEILYINTKKYQNTDKGKKAQKRYVKSVKGKKSRANIDKRHRQTQNGRTSHCASSAKYRASKLRATPSWINDDQVLEIKGFYSEAIKLTKETGVAHHVDHIVPLQGEIVSGLHVPWNLQILKASENIAKSNKISKITNHDS